MLEIQLLDSGQTEKDREAEFPKHLLLLKPLGSQVIALMVRIGPHKGLNLLLLSLFFASDQGLRLIQSTDVSSLRAFPPSYFVRVPIDSVSQSLSESDSYLKSQVRYF